jgi:hypothetical protein
VFWGPCGRFRNLCAAPREAYGARHTTGTAEANIEPSHGHVEEANVERIEEEADAAKSKATDKREETQSKN